MVVAGLFVAGSLQLGWQARRASVTYAADPRNPYVYAQTVPDAVRVTFPANFKLESVPPDDSVKFQNYALYTTSSTVTPNSVTYRRNFTIGEIIFMPPEYQELRTFYSKMDTKDQESVVLTAAATAK